MNEDELAQFQLMKKQLMLKFLDKEALERLGRVRIANAMLAEQIELYLIQLFQSGQLKGIITDEKLKSILNLVTEKRQTTIERR